ncbi:MAG: hypothetical protein R3F19_29850 [Verrucomicrobiales bacterium]
MRGVVPVGGGLRRHLFVTSVENEEWLVGDHHVRNIMRNSSGAPTIIDALLGKVSAGARRELPWLNAACNEARIYRSTGMKPPDRFSAVNADEL